ncbi:major facilitator superfamily domain-containing protein [Cytidiella melzeri]|nr:major facilitator superfamily domain-containing protein [Cytidiella melzeri]
MPRADVLATAFSLSPPQGWFSSLRRPQVHTGDQETVFQRDAPAQNSELKLPPLPSLIIVLATSTLLQISFFIIVSSSNSYAQHLGGTSTFSGLVIGIPTVFSGIALLPLLRLDRGGYRIPLHFACGSALLGHVLYGLAYQANFLYLILIGRIVSGFGFTFWMYSKRYCSDHRIVGIRRRTTLAGWLVVGQAVGFSFGPFVGGLLYKVGFSNSVFNGYTSPAWIMAGVWAIFWAFAYAFFEDVPRPPAATPEEVEMDVVPEPASAKSQDDISTTVDVAAVEVAAVQERFRMSAAQWGVAATMCWFAMTCFFILGAWESNIPVFTGSQTPLSPFNFSPFAAGNLIALGGACTFPFLFLNVFIAKRTQDRYTLALGTSMGSFGLFIALAILSTRKVNYGSLFVCWFLVALGFNLASTVTLSLLSKQLPGKFNTRISVMIQYSNYTGRVTGAVWGGSGVKVGMLNYIAFQIIMVGIGAILSTTLWRNLKAKTG